ncbi:response regulator transcription factor [Pseudoclavibacter chungangensis]|uniref:Response regulator transcription factor n=1 Tax=Pseudoclavibacter chungangensis TaxID=587635 RepID=A0A7J5C067_9MICO|nr:response regulator transcription factor [Pseudoclavibacter chungangensis]KAB1660146.1 response regulator transcription factor [Pseudoclavibacter chungangensis]NYJ66746.1 DNA-binding response OmpR family regulator [Pseudoclavibacter chungangensis]
MRLLVVDDDRPLADIVRRALTKDGHVVAVEHDGIAGLEAASSGDFDAIVLDLMLPGLSGFRVVAELRRRGVWTPVLMLTAKDGEFDEAEALDSGADDYLTKPFSLVVLAAHLRAIARRGAGERSGALRVGDLELDPRGHAVRRGGTPIELTATEFRLLEFLMRRAGRAISKSEILAGVWDDAAENAPNLVEVYIGYLRRKIDQPFGARSITTLRGVGYRFEPPSGDGSDGAHGRVTTNDAPPSS